nr:MAG TPA: hypothetical protein [Bacteriophage sp.]
MYSYFYKIKNFKIFCTFTFINFNNILVVGSLTFFNIVFILIIYKNYIILRCVKYKRIGAPVYNKKVATPRKLKINLIYN